MSTDHAPCAPPAALPPIPDGHPHKAALTYIAGHFDLALGMVVHHLGTHPPAFWVAEVASLRASYAALLASPSVVADAGAGDARDGVGMVWDAARAVRDQVWQLRAELDEARSALDAATLRAEAAADALESAASVFGEYAAMHYAKGTAEGERKAAANRAAEARYYEAAFAARAALAPSRAVPTEDRTGHPHSGDSNG